MRHTDPLTVLLVNDHAEEIKQTTISMRRSHPGCRVEVVYSAEEALVWASKKEWGVILLDEQLPLHGEVDMVSELRQRAPHSAIIVQAEHHDAQTAAKALSAGADYYAFKRSPAFLTELPILVRDQFPIGLISHLGDAAEDISLASFATGLHGPGPRFGREAAPRRMTEPVPTPPPPLQSSSLSQGRSWEGSSLGFAD